MLMKSHIYKTLFSTLILLVTINFSSLFAQDIINLQITSANQIDFEIDAIKAQNDNGPQITENFSGEIVWATDGVTEPSDEDVWSEVGSYCCDSIINSSELEGKIALIGRGACSFSDKIWNAEKAGAIAVIIANRAPLGITVGTHNAGVIIMAATAPASDSLTIPAIFISYEDRFELEQLLDAGPVMATFETKILYDGCGPDAYYTPLDQAKPLDIKVAAYTRNSDTLFNVAFNVDILDPSGTTTSFMQMEDTLLPGKDWLTGTVHDPLIEFDDEYTPSEIGTYTMTFSALSEDGADVALDNSTVVKNFEITEHTFGLDNGNPIDENGYQQNADVYELVSNGGIHDMGSYFRTGPTISSATHASFAVANPGALDVGQGFEFTATLYNADVDMDSLPDATLEETAILGSGVYTLNGSEVPNEPMFVAFDSDVILEPNGLYCLMIVSGGFAFSDQIPAYTMAGGEVYPSRSTVYRIGETTATSGFEFWNGGASGTGGSDTYPYGGRHSLIRMHMAGFEPPVSVEVLPEGLVEVFPTLTNEQVNVRFTLNERAEDVFMIVTDVSGRTMYSKAYNNILDETLNLNVNDYPVGNYFLTIQTDRGVRTEKFVVAR